MGRFSSTATSGGAHQKLLMYTHHGWGKTYQCRFYEEEYGKGLIISGESGLASLSDKDIDFVDFIAWDKTDLPEDAFDDQHLAFTQIYALLKDKNIQKEYAWIAIDSLSELSELCMKHVENNLDNPEDLRKWGSYEKKFIGAMKFLRDLPMHVYATALAKEENNDHDGIEYWPFITQAKVAKRLPALFDHVWCGLRSTKEDSSEVTIERHIITDEVRGWHGKSRDPYNRLKAVEHGGNVVELLKRMNETQGGAKK